MKSHIATFLELASIDEVYPHEDKVLAYIKHRLERAGVTYQQDTTGNIVASIPGETKERLAIAGHVDIAAPLHGREVIVTPEVIKTDGTGLLGADDKAIVALLLELADHYKATNRKPKHRLEFLLTVGEEAGLIGIQNFDYTLLQATQILVFDMLGTVNEIITRSPANFKIDVTYQGKDAHPAEWYEGVNAGKALLAAASALPQGDYAPGVIFNIGVVRIGDARNKVPGAAMLQAEARGFYKTQVTRAVNGIERHFRAIAYDYNVTPTIVLNKNVGPYELDRSGELLQKIDNILAKMHLSPHFQETYGCFDANVLATHGKEVVILGTGYYHPHSQDEYLDIAQFEQVFDFLKRIA